MIKYREGFKYQLADQIVVDLNFTVPRDYYGDFLDLIRCDGFSRLKIKRGYAWDGPSGLALDTKTFMRASLIHDALYQLIRNSVLSSTYKPKIDELMHSVCIEDGMCKLRAWYCRKAVEWFGSNFINNPRPILKAP